MGQLLHDLPHSIWASSKKANPICVYLCVYKGVSVCGLRSNTQGSMINSVWAQDPHQEDNGKWEINKWGP